GAPPSGNDGGRDVASTPRSFICYCNPQLRTLTLRSSSYSIAISCKVSAIPHHQLISTATRPRGVNSPTLRALDLLRGALRLGLIWARPMKDAKCCAGATNGT